MAKMNWEKAKKSYGRTDWTWQNPTYGFNTKEYWNSFPKTKVDMHGCEKHPAEVRLLQYKNQTKETPVLWCCQCDKHIMSLTYQDYLFYQKIKLEQEHGEPRSLILQRLGHYKK